MSLRDISPPCLEGSPSAPPFLEAHLGVPEGSPPLIMVPPDLELPGCRILSIYGWQCVSRFAEYPVRNSVPLRGERIDAEGAPYRQTIHIAF